MNGKVFIAFLIGLAVASGVTYYLTSSPEPVKTAAVQPAPAEPAAAEPVAEPAPEPAATEPPIATAKPSPAAEDRGWRKSNEKRSTRAAARPPVATAPAPAPAAQPAPSQPPATKPVETASSAPAPVPAPQPAPSYNPAPPPPPPPPKPNTVTIPAGTLLTVRLNEALNSERNHDGDSFSATLDQPLVVDGFVIAERGAKAQGRIVQVQRAGRVEGLAKLGVELVQLTASDGQRIRLNTSPFERQATSSKKKDAAKIGVGAAIGAAIGAIAGGGKGAAIGAGVGGAAGTGGVLMTRGEAAELPVETRVSFRLKEPVTVTEQLH